MENIRQWETARRNYRVIAFGSKTPAMLVSWGQRQSSCIRVRDGEGSMRPSAGLLEPRRIFMNGQRIWIPGTQDING